MKNFLLLEQQIEQAYDKKELMQDTLHQNAVQTVIDSLDKGHIRVAEKKSGQWQVNAWVKKAIFLYFYSRSLESIDCGGLQFFDKIPLKKNFAEAKIRIVPPGVARYGSYLAPGTVLMPGYVNIGAYVGEGSMIDTFATVGSGAQVGKGVHISGGVGIGGVLEPPSAQPVIIEDHVFIGSRCIIAEGVQVKEGAVLGANVVLTASTPIIDVTQAEVVITKGSIPEKAVVIPGTMPKTFAAGTFQVPCAMIIGKRKASTDEKTSLNEVLRTFQVAT